MNDDTNDISSQLSVGNVGLKFFVRNEDNPDGWFCDVHVFVEATSPRLTPPACATCGQPTYHPVHDVRAYGVIHPKA
jgi:hypothetical protein